MRISDWSSDVCSSDLVALPASAWGEKDGTVTNSERRISRQRPVFPSPGEARPDWWIISEVARRMGWKSAFAYDRPADIYREHARLSTYRNNGRRLFDIGRHGPISNPEYDALEDRKSTRLNSSTNAHSVCRPQLYT